MGTDFYFLFDSGKIPLQSIKASINSIIKYSPKRINTTLSYTGLDEWYTTRDTYLYPVTHLIVYHRYRKQTKVKISTLTYLSTKLAKKDVMND